MDYPVAYDSAAQDVVNGVGLLLVDYLQMVVEQYNSLRPVMKLAERVRITLLEWNTHISQPLGQHGQLVDAALADAAMADTAMEGPRQGRGTCGRVSGRT